MLWPDARIRAANQCSKWSLASGKFQAPPGADVRWIVGAAGDKVSVGGH
jgi:hypothetical protein